MKIIFLLWFSIFLQSVLSTPGTMRESLKPVTTCYRIELVRALAEYDMATRASSSECRIGFSIEGIKPLHVYYSQSWYNLSYCENFMKDWNEFVQRRVKVCIAGDLSRPQLERYRGYGTLERSAPWEVVRIGKWCQEHFEGHCQR